MRAVILAAGKGLRMLPLTAFTPKPLLEVGGKPIIYHVLNALPPEIDDIIIVVKYLGDKIKKRIGRYYKGIKIKYATGSDKGNAYSFMNTKKYLKDERFLLIYGDEIPNPEDIKKCLSRDLSILTYGDSIKDGVMVLNTDIFEYSPSITKSEFFSVMVDYFNIYHFVDLIKSENFIGEINTPKDLERVRICLKSL